MSTLLKCPACGVHVQVPDNLLGRKVRCIKCSEIFTADEGLASPPPSPIQHEAAPPPRRRPDPYDEGPRPRRDFEEDDYRPRRSPFLRRGYDRDQALSRVQGPAILLIVVGVLVLLLGLGCLGFAGYGLTEAAAASNNPYRSSKQQDDMVAVVFLTIGAFVNFALGAFLIFAGIRMRALRSYGVCMAAVILTFVVGGLACLPLLLAGIWPLVVLVDSNVKAAFDTPANEGSGPLY